MRIDDFLIRDFDQPTQKPFPYLYGNDYINTEILEKVLDVFPEDDHPGWEGRNWEKKQFGYSMDKLHPYILEVQDVLSSKEMRLKIQKCFDTPPLYAVFTGASAHITGPRSINSMHVDWPRYGSRLYRWINLHIFLNRDYKKEHSGELVLGKNEDVLISPEMGNMAMFLSTVDSLHGQKRWQRDDTRKSLAVFYFAMETPTPQHHLAYGTDEATGLPYFEKESELVISTQS